MLPEMSGAEGKVWGKTKLVYRRNDASAHVILIDHGGFCSKHYHKSRWNRFVVIQGELTIHTWAASEGPDVTKMGPGSIFDIPPGIIHCFIAENGPVTAVEFYWTELDDNDITRIDRGGKSE